LLSASVVAVVLSLALALLVAQRGEPFGFDSAWMTEVLEERGPWWDLPALLMDRLGGGVVGVVLVPLAIVTALVIARRPWGAVVFALVSAASAGVVQVLKAVVGRARPDEILVSADLGSFPSGHVANAATLAVVLGLLLAPRRDRWWFWMLGLTYVVAMALSRTYLGAHWVTDTIGGALLGAGLGVLIWLPFAGLVAREPRPRNAGVIAP
jgi:undecaprenyl-diphosphatase